MIKIQYLVSSIKYLVLLLVAPVMFSVVVMAQTATPLPTSGQAEATASSSISKDVQSLKDKLVDKVAQLQKKEQRVIVGVVSVVGKADIKIVATDSTVYTLILDDVVTKYYSLSTGVKKEIEKEDVVKGDYLIVSGIIEGTKVTANSIYVDSQVIVGSGSITSLNNVDFFMKVTGFNRDTLTIDVETKTKILLLDSKTIELETAGFSKIKEGDAVHYVLTVTGDEREKNRYSAQKLLIVPQEYLLSK